MEPKLITTETREWLDRIYAAAPFDEDDRKVNAYIAGMNVADYDRVRALLAENEDARAWAAWFAAEAEWFTVAIARVSELLGRPLMPWQRLAADLTDAVAADLDNAATSC